jgi:acylphosphatase
MKRLQAEVTGRVQGVGFRDFVLRQANARGLFGWVRNSDNGRSVELCAEGEEEALLSLVEAVREGPRFSRVEDVACEWSEPTGGFSKFSMEI